MPEELEQLLDSLLFEGYALYPYTPTATKNATPTPFGIAYPPAYAATLASTFDHVELRCVLEAPPAARIGGEVRFLTAGEGRHRAAAQRLSLPDVDAEALLGGSGESETRTRESKISTPGDAPLRVALELGVNELEPGGEAGPRLLEVVLRVENRTPCAAGLDRATALSHSLISTHPLVRVQDGRFISPLERPCASVNTFPVLADAGDRAVLGATIVLPDHPQIAPESHGALFDGTEIEEALLLHVKALSDGERAEIERDDRRVREMIERAEAATPRDVLALHGRVTLRDPAPARERFTASPPQEPPGLADPTLGEAEAEVDGVRFRRGDKVRICPGAKADLHARLLDGRVATIERILLDYDGKAHLGVTIDGDPGQELLRDSGRLLFFFAPEVEVLDP
jgi:hypothetical protein